MLGAAALLGVIFSFTPTIVNDVPPVTPTVEVDDNRLVDENGRVIQLRGVNRSGTEYSCVQGLGIFDGPADPASIEAMTSWKINTIRIPLNEDCWLGDPRLDPATAGVPYREAVTEFADLLHDAGFVVILDLHWTGDGSGIAAEQQPLARQGRSAEFWRSVASAFQHRSGVVFDVFNEPHDVDWDCWRDGCNGYAGMQDLVDAIRSTGATHPIVLSGLDWGGDLRGWLEFRPDDPADALVAGVHLYDFKRCTTRECWDSELGTIAKRHPVVVTEFGDTDCNGDFSNALMRWADNAGVSYLAWSWNEWDCDGGPAVISDFAGVATAYGEVVRTRLLARSTQPDLPRLLPPGAQPI